MSVPSILNTHWDQVDVTQFSLTDYDLLYFTGDLGGGTSDSCLRMARAMWGCDLMDYGGDWGDPDLAVAIDHAGAVGKCASTPSSISGDSGRLAWPGRAAHRRPLSRPQA